MRVTQGTFSFLPDFTDEDIEKQIKYALGKGWAMMLEYTDDPHPRNSFWEMWKQPDFDLDPDDTEPTMKDVHGCREAYPNHYIRLVAYDSSLGRQTSRLSFIINRPQEEPGYRLVRSEKHDRSVQYTVEPYALQDAMGRRYGNPGRLDVTRDPAAVQEASPGYDSPISGQQDEDTPKPFEDVAPQKDEGIGES